MEVQKLVVGVNYRTTRLDENVEQELFRRKLDLSAR
jgi:hypothetical protein